jgi:hypothetical protein
VAARRLIAVMLVLLFLSSLAAALAPVERPNEEASTSTTTTTEEPGTTDGELVRADLDLRKQDPPPVRARVGDQLQLRVLADRPGTIELAGLGLSEYVDEFAPAFFDLLLDRKDTIKVRYLESRKLLGTIEVLPSRPARKGSRQDPAPARS